MEIKEECVKKHISQDEIDLFRFNCVEILRVLSLIDLRDGKFTAMYRDKNSKVKECELFFLFYNTLLDLMIKTKHIEDKFQKIVSDSVDLD